MFHVEQPSCLLTPIYCYDLCFSAGAPGREHVPEATGKSDGELENALADARPVGGDDPSGELRKQKIVKKTRGEL